MLFAAEKTNDSNATTALRPRKAVAGPWVAGNGPWTSGKRNRSNTQTAAHNTTDRRNIHVSMCRVWSRVS